MARPLVSIAYKCRSTESVVDDENLAAILAVSQKHNVRDGLTGVLTYSDGQFLQVLEGPKTSVMATIGRIRADTRHDGLAIVGPTEIFERVFP